MKREVINECYEDLFVHHMQELVVLEEGWLALLICHYRPVYFNMITHLWAKSDTDNPLIHFNVNGSTQSLMGWGAARFNNC